jgi:hypothetical protein
LRAEIHVILSLNSDFTIEKSHKIEGLKIISC